MFFTTFFMARRFLLALTIVTLVQWNWAQTILTIFVNCLAIIYQGAYRPYLLPQHNHKELMNEAFIMLCTYFLFFYSEFVPDRNSRYLMGYVNIGCLGLMVLFNLTVIVIGQVRTTARALKLRKMKKDFKAKLAKMKDIRNSERQKSISSKYNLVFSTCLL